MERDASTLDDLSREFQNVEDYLIPKLQLDCWERALYYHLLRHTRVIGRDSSRFGLLSLAGSSGLSETTVRERIRTLDRKRCIEILQRSGEGHLLRVLLPTEIEGVVPPVIEVPTDIDTIDFYSGRKYADALVNREQGRCFYCLRAITAESCVLDHAISRVSGGDDSFRNVVAACHECNSAKQSQDPREFLRSRYRQNLLSGSELQERIATLGRLQSGQLRPAI